MAKAAGKHNAALTVIAQEVADPLGSDLGGAFAANAATQILMRQAPHAIVLIPYALVGGPFGAEDRSPVIR